MDADLCALSLESPHTRPVHDPIVAVIHSARATDVILTMVQGRILHGAGSDIRAAALPLREQFDAAAARLREAVPG
jgi:cytosine/adenosine deaminase-related metal-dependent hydrolase